MTVDGEGSVVKEATLRVSMMTLEKGRGRGHNFVDPILALGGLSPIARIAPLVFKLNMETEGLRPTGLDLHR